MPFHYSYGQWLPCQGLNQNENSDELIYLKYSDHGDCALAYSGGLLEVILACVKNSLIPGFNL